MVNISSAWNTYNSCRREKCSIFLKNVCVHVNVSLCVWLCRSLGQRMRWVQEMERWGMCAVCVCVCVSWGVGALVRVRQQRVPHLSRNLSQSKLTNRVSRTKRRTRSEMNWEKDRKENWGVRNQGGRGQQYKDLKKKKRRINWQILSWI